MTTQPELTDEEAAALREQLAAHDAAQGEIRKAANRVKLQPLLDLGFGGTGPLTCSADQLTAALRAAATTLAEIDPTLPHHFFTTAQVLETANGKVRSLVMQNAATPAPD